METKSNLDTMKYVQNKIWFKHGLIILSEGRSGGTALLWKIESLVHIQHFSKWYIDVHVDGGQNIGWCCIIGFMVIQKPQREKNLGNFSNTYTKGIIYHVWLWGILMKLWG